MHVAHAKAMASDPEQTPCFLMELFRRAGQCDINLSDMIELFGSGCAYFPCGRDDLWELMIWT
jgi:hypothetical protein